MPGRPSVTHDTSQLAALLGLVNTQVCFGAWGTCARGACASGVGSRVASAGPTRSALTSRSENLRLGLRGSSTVPGTEKRRAGLQLHLHQALRWAAMSHCVVTLRWAVPSREPWNWNCFAACATRCCRQLARLRLHAALRRRARCPKSLAPERRLRRARARAPEQPERGTSSWLLAPRPAAPRSRRPPQTARAARPLPRRPSPLWRARGGPGAAESWWGAVAAAVGAAPAAPAEPTGAAAPAAGAGPAALGAAGSRPPAAAAAPHAPS
jgi:hypothetical protein